MVKAADFSRAAKAAMSASRSSGVGGGSPWTRDTPITATATTARAAVTPRGDHQRPAGRAPPGRGALGPHGSSSGSALTLRVSGATAPALTARQAELRWGAAG